MKRVEFTRAINNLIAAMILEGENPIIDYVKRSDEEQMRLYLKKRSKCDGVILRSAHQSGSAMDIYFLNDEHSEIVEPKKGFTYWHTYWEGKGGQPMIEWDKGHFE